MVENEETETDRTVGQVGQEVDRTVGQVGQKIEEYKCPECGRDSRSQEGLNSHIEPKIEPTAVEKKILEVKRNLSR